MEDIANTWEGEEHRNADLISSPTDVEEASGHTQSMAPDDRKAWVAMSDIALRHILRVSTAFLHRQDVESAELKWPDDLPRSDVTTPDTPTPTFRVVLVNEDQHVPVRFRHPPTAPYVLQAISDVYPALTGRPSRTYTPYSRLWNCPQAQCTYSEDLARLSPAAGEAVCQIAATALDSNLVADFVASEFVRLVGGRYCARREFIQNVVDIIGLRHYESHLHDMGLRCWIRGQAPDGRISFMWEHVNLLEVLRSRSIDGVRARKHEEAARQSLQKALSVQARRWAHESRFWNYEGTTVQRNRARTMQHDFIKTLASPLIQLEARGRFSRLRTLTSDQSATVLAIGRSVHEMIYNSLGEREVEYQELMHCLAIAEEEIGHWERGDGLARTQERGDDPDLYI